MHFSRSKRFTCECKQHCDVTFLFDVYLLLNSLIGIGDIQFKNYLHRYFSKVNRTIINIKIQSQLLSVVQNLSIFVSGSLNMKWCMLPMWLMDLEFNRLPTDLGQFFYFRFCKCPSCSCGIISGICANGEIVTLVWNKTNKPNQKSRPKIKLL